MANNKKTYLDEHIIDLIGVTRQFEDGVIAVDNFNFYVRRGEFVTFLGPSFSIACNHASLSFTPSTGNTAL